MNCILIIFEKYNSINCGSIKQNARIVEMLTFISHIYIYVSIIILFVSYGFIPGIIVSLLNLDIYILLHIYDTKLIYNLIYKTIKNVYIYTFT